MAESDGWPLFLMKFTYYKLSGKFYTSDSAAVRARCLEPGRYPYLDDVVEWFRRQERDRNVLPGLSTCHWDGYVVVTDSGPGSLSHLIVPGE